MILVPFSIFGIFKKAPFGRPFQPPRLQAGTGKSASRRPCRDPAFHETIVITMPFGPTGFLKVVF